MTPVKRDILRRVYFVFAFICLIGGAVVWRIWQLQFKEGAYWAAQADSLTTKTQTVAAARGNIYSFDDMLLATSAPIYDIHIDFKAEGFTSSAYNTQVPLLAQKLSAMFPDKSANAFLRILNEGRAKKLRYALLRRNVTHKQLKEMRTFPIFSLGRFKGGFIFDQRNKRELPMGKLASRTIGQSRKNAQNVGIEGYFDHYLKGKDGFRVMQKISGGVWKPVNAENDIEPKDGYDVISTLDANIQDVAQYALETRLKERKAEAGCAILMDVPTGEIRAIVNLRRRADGSYGEEYNMAVGSSTEPGSTFKLISLMAAIEDRHVDLDDTVDAGNGKVHWIKGKAMNDSHHGGYGRISVKRAFEVSSNVGISKIIHHNYSKNPQDFIDRLHRMHVGDFLGLQIKGEGKPVIKNAENKSWSKTTLPYMSIGYECSLTPLQVLAFYNAVANNGVMVKPLFVKAIRDKGRVIEEYLPQVIDSAICSPATIAKAREMLEGVVQNGTATNLKHSQYGIAGKTGTARIANNSKGYEEIKYQASFVGYFPADKPRYSCMVVVYAPSNDVFYAAQVAAPVFKDISDKLYATNLDLHEVVPEDPSIRTHPPLAKSGRVHPARLVYAGLSMDASVLSDDMDWMTISRNGQIKKRQADPSQGRVPDVTGMGLRDAVLLLEQSGLQVSVQGRGTVTKQSLPAGSAAAQGQHILIELN